MECKVQTYDCQWSEIDWRCSRNLCKTMLVNYWRLKSWTEDALRMSCQQWHVVCVCVCEYGRVGVAAVASMQWSMLTPCGQNLGCSPRNRECSQISLVYRVFVFFCKKTTTKQILHTHTRTHKCIVSGHHICCCLVSLHKWLSVEVLVLDSLRGSEMQFYGGHSLTKQ